MPTRGVAPIGAAHYFRRETQNRLGLPDALRVIVPARATIDTETPPAKVLAIGDGATKTHVLEELSPSGVRRQWP